MSVWRMISGSGPLVVIRGDVNYVAIGARTKIQDGSVLSRNPQAPVQSTRQPINHWRRCTVGHSYAARLKFIGNRVLVGMGSIVLDGA